ncbi:hypothetical protein [Duganella levis]|uniref:MchC protein n=1 Tax=Duganella levis TaxID=2692169 RepID=A0ABW9W7R0_9BURK|nr:hypothetical protein [Duganella levis]MYN30114.1 hypothetical protein [Duganella levis]
MLKLPDSSFLKFKATKLACPQTKWMNPQLPISDAHMKELTFCLPMDGENSSIYCTDRREFLAERYGGAGLGLNGGGVRCGLVGDTQIKGIGKNILAGATDDYWHTYGGSTLEEGIQEAMWGEVCDIALPYGAARVKGIITTGSTIRSRNFQGEGLSDRALIFREFIIRPAHYMRSVFFTGSWDQTIAIIPDSIRTSKAISSLYDYIQRENITSDEGSLSTHINKLLVQICRRIASQFAAARAKKIMHGTITASNIGMDGRWIDFGTISTVSDYGRIKIGTNIYSDMTIEYSSTKNWMDELIFYIRKYSPRKIANDIINSKELARVYDFTYFSRLQVEMVKLTGVPEHKMPDINPTLLADMAKAISKILEDAMFKPFKIDFPNHWHMPEYMGNNHLSSILTTAAFSYTKDQLVKTTESLIKNKNVHREFCNSYWKLKEEFSNSVPVSNRKNLEIYRTVNSLRRNISVPELYRTKIENDIKNIIDKNDSVPKYIAKIAKIANFHFGEEEKGPIELDACFENLRLDLKHGLHINNVEVKIKDLLVRGPFTKLTPSQIDLFEKYAQYIEN